MKNVRLATVVVTLLVLAGCAGRDAAPAETSTPSVVETPTAAPSETPSPTPTASPSATPTATETAEPAGKPELGDILLSSEGLGYVKISQPVPDVPESEQIVTWNDDFCGFGDDSDDAPGGWKTQYPTNENGNLAFYVQAYPDKTSPVTAIYIINPKIHTKHGLHVGSSLAEVKELGGVKEKIDSSYYDVAWVIHGSAGKLAFFLDGDEVAHITVVPEKEKIEFVGEITPCA